MEKEKILQYARAFLDLIGKTARLPDDRQNLGYGRGQRMILFYLSNHPDGVPSGELSSSLHVGTGRIGNALKELEKKGYILRKADAADRRKVLVFLTGKGIAYTDERRQELLRNIEHGIQAVGEERFQAFLETWAELASAAQEENAGKEETCSSSTRD